MYCGGGREGELWDCGKVRAMNLQRMGSIVRDIGDPCLSQSPIKNAEAGKVARQLLIVMARFQGVDPSIRPEVWEFLLGCYALGTTAEYRRQLRAARRERYKELIKQCQIMHSSIGTGSLAYVVGSKVMDMRTSSKDDGRKEDKVESRQASIDNTNQLENFCDLSNNCTDTSYACKRESSTDSADLVSVWESLDSAAYDSSCFVPTSDPYNCNTPNPGRESNGSQVVTESYFDFPHLPVTNLFETSGNNDEEYGVCEDEPSTQQLRFEDDRMHSFQISNNAELIMESNGSPSNNISHPMNSEIEMEWLSVETGVSEWLWTLHRIVVDVVRTDSHLEFYEDTRNLARMSDILAVYAWVDPATGYCQGMSDLLSPFVVLFEDNADAFWCFEMLLRRTRENFQMEGPTGVMKQLQALWHILELTDREMFSHLSNIGAESLHFAFRMLLVLFRRELSFNDALRMWEMMWAADFDMSLINNLEENCLEALIIRLPSESDAEIREENTENGGGTDLKGGLEQKNGNVEGSMPDNVGVKSASGHPFCGLTRNLWSRNHHLQNCTVVSSTGSGDDELPVFCVAAILILNRNKVVKETRSIDDMIKAGALLTIHVFFLLAIKY
ncbi:hypothetical protein Patl1_26507 [Pistacia atlantica]|uniref:Uncharacterized protein n=1 Tax=Pistacia atlantica TaxID=434234 RepID=A0ACC1AZ26_9ROSI|nr:hypothetical protein Patl1_26507 [Pistacia atlantica]